jgi:NAD-dependent dihydropyrimidine dehydrogenase PreA subunit
MHYQAQIIVSACPRDSYRAITEEMGEWWTPMSGQFFELGDKAKTDFGGKSYWVFEAKTLNEPSLVELRCCDANHIHDGLPADIKDEWLDSILRFEISEAEDGTSITLIHQGLHNELLCYDVCKAGWDHYFLGSLKNHLNR